MNGEIHQTKEKKKDIQESLRTKNHSFTHPSIEEGKRKERKERRKNQRGARDFDFPTFLLFSSSPVDVGKQRSREWYISGNGENEMQRKKKTGEKKKRGKMERSTRNHIEISNLPDVTEEASVTTPAAVELFRCLGWNWGHHDPSPTWRGQSRWRRRWSFVVRLLVVVPWSHRSEDRACQSVSGPPMTWIKSLIFFMSFMISFPPPEPRIWNDSSIL